MSEDTGEARRRQTVMRAIVLAFAGSGYCPSCHRQKERFFRRRVRPGAVKARCLDGWRAEP